MLRDRPEKLFVVVLKNHSQMLQRILSFSLRNLFLFLLYLKKLIFRENVTKVKMLE